MLLERARAQAGRPGSGADVVNEDNRLVLFIVDDQKYALPLEIVDRVVRAVEVTPLPEAPPVVAGIFNLHGRPVPVVDLRRRFRLPERAIDVDDHFIVAQSSTMLVAFPVDEALGLVKEFDDEPVPAADVVPDLPYVASVVPSGAEMVYVLDIDTVLTDDESDTLQQKLDEVPE
jgi:purine-binding chemotaxis protein CheW